MNKYLLNFMNSINTLTSFDVSLVHNLGSKEDFIYSTNKKSESIYMQTKIKCVEKRFSNSIFLTSNIDNFCFLQLYINDEIKILVGPFFLATYTQSSDTNIDYINAIVDLFLAIDKTNFLNSRNKTTKYEENYVFKNYQKIYFATRSNYVNRSPNNLENQLKSAIRDGDKKRAIEVNNKINEMDRANLSDNNLRSLKYSFVCDCSIFTRECLKVGIHHSKAYAFSDSVIRRIDEINSSEYLLKFENIMIGLFCDFIILEKNQDYSYLVTKTIHYLESNIKNKIDINDLAKELNVSKPYLCNLFKKETGSTILNYSTKMVIDEATYLLKTTNLSIAEIGYLYNFCNESYFVSVYKKHTGVTPNSIRKKPSK